MNELADICVCELWIPRVVNLVVNLSILIVSTVERLHVFLHVNAILQFDDVLCGGSFRLTHGRTKAGYRNDP